MNKIFSNVEIIGNNTGTTLTVSGSSAFGIETISTGYYSHAEGGFNISSGYFSHAEGGYNTSSAYYSHVEGANNAAIGNYSHAEGNYTVASGQRSHSEGFSTSATSVGSHAEGYATLASGLNSHAEGGNTTSSSYNSHAEGYRTTASNYSSHAEGGYTTASGYYSHAQGIYTSATTYGAHSEGGYTSASGQYSHAEGGYTTASGPYSHSEGFNSESAGQSSHSGGESVYVSGKTSFIHSNTSLLNAHRSVILGGENISGYTNDTVYLPYLNLNYNPSTGSTNNQLLTRDVDGSVKVISPSLLLFTGNTSGNCITNLFVTNLNSCSPLHIQPTNNGDVYILENGGSLGLNTTSLDAKLSIKSTSDNSSTTSLSIRNSGSTPMFGVRDDSWVYQGNGIPTPTYPDPNIKASFLNAIWSYGGIYLGNDINNHSTNIPNGTLRLGKDANLAFYADYGGPGEYTYGGQIYANYTTGVLNIRGGVGGTMFKTGQANADAMFVGIGDPNVGFNTSSPTANVHIKGVRDNSVSYSLKIENSASTTTLSVRDDGRIGMGTLSPESQLHLYGDSGMTIQSSTGGYGRLKIIPYSPTQLYSSIVDADGTELRMSGGFGANSGRWRLNNNSNNARLGINTTAAAANLYIVGEGNAGLTNIVDIVNSSSSPMLMLVDNGKMGLGTISPSEKLHIQDGKAYVNDNSIGNYTGMKYVFEVGGGSWGMGFNYSKNAIVLLTAGSNTGKLIFGGGANASSPNEKVTFDLAGSPVGFYGFGNYSGNYNFEIRSNASGASSYDVFTIDDTTGNPFFRILKTKEVGIGVSPSSMLDVSGYTGYNQFRLRTSYTPSSSGDTNGNIGDFSWDNNYLYMKTVSGWGRTLLSYSF